MNIKKYDLFATSPSILAEAIRGAKMNCCSICTAPFFGLCKPFCKYNNKAVRVYLEDKLGEEYDKAFREG